MQIAVLIALAFILCLAAGVSAIKAVNGDDLDEERKAR